MLDCTVEQFDVDPSRLVADAGYGSADGSRCSSLI
jgi:hypothetical protein